MKLKTVILLPFVFVAGLSVWLFVLWKNTQVVSPSEFSQAGKISAQNIAYLNNSADLLIEPKIDILKNLSHLAAQTDDTLSQIKADYLIGRVQCEMLNYQDGLDKLYETLNQAIAYGDFGLGSKIASSFSQTLFAIGSPNLAIEFCRQSLDLANSSGDQETIAESTAALIIGLSLAQNFGEARSYLETLEENTFGVEDRSVIFCRAFLYQCTRQFDKAKREYGRLLKLDTSKTVKLMTHYQLGNTLLEIGESLAAENNFKETLTLAKNSNVKYLEISGLKKVYQAHLQREDQASTVRKMIALVQAEDDMKMQEKIQLAQQKVAEIASSILREKVKTSSENQIKNEKETKIILVGFYALLFFILMLFVVAYLAMRKEKKAKHQLSGLSTQSKLQLEKIEDSIRYGRRLEKAFLKFAPPRKEFNIAYASPENKYALFQWRKKSPLGKMTYFSQSLVDDLHNSFSRILQQNMLTVYADSLKDGAEEQEENFCKKALSSHSEMFPDSEFSLCFIHENERKKFINIWMNACYAYLGKPKDGFKEIIISNKKLNATNAETFSALVENEDFSALAGLSAFSISFLVPEYYEFQIHLLDRNYSELQQTP